MGEVAMRLVIGETFGDSERGYTIRKHLISSTLQQTIKNCLFGARYLLINASINHSKYRMILFLEFILLALLHSVSHLT